MAKLSALFFVAVVWFVFVSGCLGKSPQCVLDVTYPCAAPGSNNCRLVCEPRVGSDELISYQCIIKELPTHVAIGVCRCIYACPSKEGADMSSMTALSPDV